MPETVRTAVSRALVAFESLQLVGEDVEDEWTYVQALGAAWRDRLESVAIERGDDPVAAPTSVAIDRAIDEVGRIVDPHRAIDWLSTFPQVVLVALGERP